jgi:hypothetical protein
MTKYSRRELLCLAMASSVYLARAPALHARQQPPDVYRLLLDLADRQQQERRARFATVTTPAKLESLQKSLRDDFLRLIGGLPTSNLPPPANATRVVEADNSPLSSSSSFPGYFVPALLYRPRRARAATSRSQPHGHSAINKAADTYQFTRQPRPAVHRADVRPSARRTDRSGMPPKVVAVQSGLRRTHRARQRSISWGQAGPLPDLTACGHRLSGLAAEWIKRIGCVQIRAAALTAYISA